MESIGDALRRHLECEDGPALAQRAFAFSSICSVASKATTKAAFGASAAVTTPGPQATSIKRPLAALPSAEPKRALTSASTLKQDRSAKSADRARPACPSHLAATARTGLSSQIQSSRHSGNSVLCPRSVPSTKRVIRCSRESYRKNRTTTRFHTARVICRLTPSGILAAVCPQRSDNGHKFAGQLAGLLGETSNQWVRGLDTCKP